MIPARQLLGAAGLGVAAAAVALEHSGLLWTAVLMLGSSLALRLIAAFRKRRPPSPTDSLSASKDG